MSRPNPKGTYRWYLTFLETADVVAIWPTSYDSRLKALAAFDTLRSKIPVRYRPTIRLHRVRVAGAARSRSPSSPGSPTTPSSLG